MFVFDIQFISSSKQIFAPSFLIIRAKALNSLCLYATLTRVTGNLFSPSVLHFLLYKDHKFGKDQESKLPNSPFPDHQ